MMTHSLRTYVTLLVSLFMPVVLMAADIKFTAQAEPTAIVGQPFRVQYQVNESGSDPQWPSFDGFEVISGPQTSTSSSTQIINGKMTRSKSTIYTFILSATKEGQYTISAATITAGKQKCHSNALNIKVLPEDKSGDAKSSTQGQNISADNVFIKAITSRTNVYEQEAIVVTYKLFFRVDITNIQPTEFPDFKGFLVQEIELPTDRRPDVENYNGRNYNTYEIRKVLLFPQHAGTHTIDAMKTNVVIRLQSQRAPRSFFDSFFDTYQDVEKQLTAPKVNIEVKALPQPRPADFSGVVGSLSLSSSISSQEVNTDDPITIKLNISGTGNLKMLKNPGLRLPTDFETYEPKATNKFNTGSEGLSGSKTVEYLAIPRHNGDFTIPSATFSYFDSKEKKYKQLATPAYTIKVNKGTSSSSNGESTAAPIVNDFTKSEKVTITATDIRFINTEPLKLYKQEQYLAGTPLFWLLFIIPLLVVVPLGLFFRRQIRESADMALMRNKKANKMARRRLSAAASHAKKGNKAEFFDEILRALWGYIADKLSIPVAELNKDNISARLTDKGVGEEVIATFIAVLNECEYERYAPSSDTQAVMEKTYNTTIDLISTLESTIKRHKKAN